MHLADGPSLPLGRKLCGKAEPQVFHPLPLLRHSTCHSTQTGLSMVALTFTLDWWHGELYAKQLNDLQYYTYYFSCITSYMLASSIGFLFVTQMLTACSNITTLESFTEGVYKHVPPPLCRTPSPERPKSTTSGRFSAARVGSCPRTPSPPTAPSSTAPLMYSDSKPDRLIYHLTQVSGLA